MVKFAQTSWMLPLGCLTVLFAAWVVAGHTEVSTSLKPEWQLSEGLQVQLGVRDKYGVLGSYEAVFIVTGPDGRQAKATLQVRDNEFGNVLFPDDFLWLDIYPYPKKQGKFSWECRVNGRAVVKGRFEWRDHGAWARIFR